MRNRFSPLHTGIVAAFLSGCGGQAIDATEPVGATDDPFASLEQALTPLATTCTFVNTGVRTMTVTLAAGEMAFIRKAGTAPDDFLQVNGAECNIPVPVSGSTSVQRLNVTASTTAVTNESVVLDFTNGTFLLSTVATTPNITVNLGTGTGDMLGIRLNDGGVTDQFVTYGTTGINLATTAIEVIKDITVTGVEIHRVSLGDGNDTFTARGDTGTGAAFDPGTGGALEIYGGAGNDTILEGPLKTNKELINGGSGTDSVSYSQRTAGVTVQMTVAGSGADTLTPDGEATEADDIKDDVEIITGGSAADLLVGLGSVAETITGGAGNDTITGGNAANVLSGGDGNDRFVETLATSIGETITGGNGIDTIDYGARTTTAALVVSLDAALTSGLASENDSLGADIENIIGGTGADSLVGNALNNVIQGRLGLDTIDGGAGIDTVDYSDRTAGVNVTLVGTTASGLLTCAATAQGSATVELDLICESIENATGGSGADTLTGGAGANELVGGDGLDTLLGAAGDDILEGGSASNTDANILTGGAGIDVCYGGTANVKTTCEF